MFELQNNYLEEGDHWSVIIAAMFFTVCGTYHTMLQATSVKLVFGCNMILNNPFIADWETIMRCKKQLTDNKNKTKIKITNRTFIKYMRTY